jgi:hypothetical protein
MRVSQPVKNLLKYLSVLAVLAATIIGLFIGKDLYPPSFHSQAETNSSQLLLITEAVDSCVSPLIYTSLPPKCKTADGKFIPIPWASSYIFVIPKGK